MSGRFFLDTNVLVYSFDQRAPKKQKVAKQLIADALRTEKGFVSSQVIQEFINVAVRKFEKPFSASDAVQYLEKVLEPLCDVYSSVSNFQRALLLRERFQLQWFDSLIVAAALEGDAQTLYTEDLQDGQEIEGLVIKNPF